MVSSGQDHSIYTWTRYTLAFYQLLNTSWSQWRDATYVKRDEKGCTLSNPLLWPSCKLPAVFFSANRLLPSMMKARWWGMGPERSRPLKHCFTHAITTLMMMFITLYDANITFDVSHYKPRHNHTNEQTRTPLLCFGDELHSISNFRFKWNFDAQIEIQTSVPITTCQIAVVPESEVSQFSLCFPTNQIQIADWSCVTNLNYDLIIRLIGSLRI